MTLSPQGLPICPKCGWAISRMDAAHHEPECSPQAGEVARKLAASVPVPSTMFGHGYGRLTFNFSDDHSLTLHIGSQGEISVDHIFWLEDLTQKRTVTLVKLLAEAVKS